MSEIGDPSKPFHLKPWIASSETQRLWAPWGMFDPWIYRNSHAYQVDDPGEYYFVIPPSIDLKKAFFFILTPDTRAAYHLQYVVKGEEHFGIYCAIHNHRLLKLTVREQMLSDGNPVPTALPVILFCGEKVGYDAVPMPVPIDILKRKVEAADALADVLASRLDAVGCLGSMNQDIVDKLNAYRSIK